MSGLPSAPTLLAFAGLAFGLAVTPGPNMAYLISCSICRGRWAGLVSLGGLGLVDSDGLGLVSLVADSSPSAVQALRTRQRLTRSGTARRMKAPLVVVRVPPVGAVR